MFLFCIWHGCSTTENGLNKISGHSLLTHITIRAHKVMVHKPHLPGSLFKLVFSGAHSSQDDLSEEQILLSVLAVNDSWLAIF